MSAVGFPCHGGKAVNRIGCQATRAGSQSRQQTARAGMLGEPGRRVRPAVCHRESSRADTVTPARRGKRRPRPVHWVTAIPAPNWRICVHRLDLMRRRNTANIRQLARTVQKSLRSVIAADPGSRTRSRRYLEPDFRCLRCKHGGSRASARTRYLEQCQGRELARNPLSLPLLGVCGCVRNAPLGHVNAADHLVSGTFSKRAPNNRRSNRTTR